MEYPCEPLLFYDSPLCSDCDVYLSDNTAFKGHKAILCSRSGFFNAKLTHYQVSLNVASFQTRHAHIKANDWLTEKLQGGSNELDLREEDHDAVRACLLFVYDRIEIFDIFQQSWNTTSNLIARTYRVADCYLLTGFKRRIIKYLDSQDFYSLNPGTWERLVRTVYGPEFPWMSPEDKLLREVLVYRTAQPNSIVSEVTNSLVGTVPEFAKDFARRMASDVSNLGGGVVFPPPDTNWDAIPLF